MVSNPVSPSGHYSIAAVLTRPLFSITIFLSASLLFWVQPLIAKILLPLLGGSPSVWNTCMVFFQAALLAGYGYSLLISRLSLRTQGMIQVGLLVAAVIVLPFSAPISAPESSPTFWVLTQLTV